MRVPGADEATDRLAHWVRKGRWKTREAEVFSAHLGPVGEALGREPAEVGEQLGPLAGQVSVAIFEDFLAAGRELVASELGSLVGTPLTSHEDPLSPLGEMAEGPSRVGTLLDGPPADPAASPSPTDEMQSLAAAYLEDQYRRTLDEPVRMLGNRTPRQAARTRKGRAEVVEWLKEIENVESRGAAMEGRQPMDTTWLWEELKIPRPGGNL